MTDTYRSRWDACDECDTVVIVERDDERGVPDANEWLDIPSCPVCDETFRFYNADEKTQREAAMSQGAQMAYRLLVAELRNQAAALGEPAAPFLNARADELEVEGRAKRGLVTR